MNLRQLRYFYDTARTQSLTKAAQLHTVPASSVSAAIRRLEEELGVELFDRTANRIVLNAKGKVFANELRLAFEKLDHAVGQVTEPLREKPNIRILVRARPKWIAELIVEYMSGNPEISFTISNDYSLRDLEDFDIIIDELSEQYRDWQHFLLSVEIICVKAAVNSRLSGAELTFRQLKDEVFILPSRGNGMRDLYERLCRQYGMTPNVAIECNDRQLLQYYVQSGLGLTLGAFRALQDQTQDAIAPLTVVDFNETQSVHVFYRARDDRSTALRDFCEFLYSKRYLQ